MLVGRVDGGAAVVAPVLLRQLLDEEGGGRLPRLLLRVDPAARSDPRGGVLERFPCIHYGQIAQTHIG